MRKQIVTVLAGCLLGGGLSLGLATGTAAAAPSPNAGCVGQTVTAIGPPPVQDQPIGWYFSWLAQQPTNACWAGE